MYRLCAQFCRPVTSLLSLPRADTTVRPYTEIVRVTPHDETNVEFAQLCVAVGWTHRMNVVVFDKNPLRRGGPPRPPARAGAVVTDGASLVDVKMSA
jgi:hypothetical protein